MLFEREYIEALIDTVKDKSDNEDGEFCRIYADPKAYVRPFEGDTNRSLLPNSCPAYLGVSDILAVPVRIKDSEIITMKLSEENLNQFYQLETLEEKHPSERYFKYKKRFEVNQESKSIN